MRTEHHTAPTETVGKNYAGRYAAVTIDGERVELRVPKGTRGIKVGTPLTVRVEHRDYYKLNRTTIKIGVGHTTEELRENYHDGEHAHYYLELEG